ncbi:MAG: peroxiredoxin-like family protein [Paracoccaceae bacterium]
MTPPRDPETTALDPTALGAALERVARERRATEALAARDGAGRALRVGDRAPCFALASESGAVLRSDVALARGPLAISFYRGLWCVGCEAELTTLQAALPAIEAHGATLIAVSPQSAADSRRSKRQAGAAFDVLSDHRDALARRFGLVHRLPDATPDVERAPGDDERTLAMPARFVVAPDGRIAHAEVHADHAHRPGPEALIGALARLSPTA